MGTKNLYRRFIVLALLGFLAAALPAAAKPPVADVQIGAAAATFTSTGSNVALELRVTGPKGFVHQETVAAGGVLVFHYADSSGAPLADGQYTYEVRPNPAPHGKVREGSELSAWKPAAEALSGTFSIRGGGAVDPGQPEQLPTKDQVIPDDLIVQGSICAGFDCVNGESFGFDTIRLKENNLRIKFEDTSTGTFPTTDWQLTANDSASGGANKFSIEDITSSRVPFTITGGAPTNSVFVDSSGRMGLGTSTPVLNLHVTSGNTPALRLEQNGSSGFTAQTWDIAGNEASFFVRDVTSGSRLPFRIIPGAPSNSLSVSADGDVGVGTLSPAAKLHVTNSGTGTNVRITGTNAGFQLEDTDNTNRRIQHLLDANLYRLRSIDSGGADVVGGISMSANTGVVGVNCNDGAAPAANPNADFVVGDGNACDGVYTAIVAGNAPVTSSSRTLKENLQSVAAADILEKIAGIEVYTYDFTGGAKGRMGLMAEDFHQVFGRGSDKMIDMQEVEMALWLAVQELTAQNHGLASQNAELAARLAALESKIDVAE